MSRQEKGTVDQLSRYFGATVENGPQAVSLAVVAKRRGARQKIKEFSGLVNSLRGRELTTVVEIGTLYGGTLWTWCRLARRDATIVSIDFPLEQFQGANAASHEARLQSYSRPGQSLHLFRGDSHDPQLRNGVMEALRDRRVDFLFIDGDHSYAGVKQDFESYAPLLRPDGLVAFHDILPHSSSNGSEVDRFWAELKGERPDSTYELVDTSDVSPSHGQWGGIGVVTTSAFRA